MTAVALGITLNNRTAARTPTVLIKNLILEPDITNLVDEKSWITRPGTTLAPPPPGGLFRGLFQQDELINGFFLVVSGNGIYIQNLPTPAYLYIGAIPGSDLATFAASNIQILINAGGKAYSYDGTTLTQVVMPSAQTVSWVQYLAGYFLLGVAGSNVIFFMPQGSTAPAALDYFSAATNTGNLVRGMVLSDQLVLFGQKVTEFWQPSGDPDLPLSRIVGQVYQKGLADKYAVCQVDNTLLFVGDDLSVYRCEAVPVRVSSYSIDEQLRKNANDFRLQLNNDPSLPTWSFSLDGHSYFVLTIGNYGTFVFDADTQAWLSWMTGAGPLWNCQYGMQIRGGQIAAGNASDANIYNVAGNATDDYGVPITREIMGGVGILGAPQRCNNFCVTVDAGGGASLSADMEVDLRWSDDQGQTYSAWRPMNAGAAGQYDAQPVAKMLGMMRAPGRVFHLRCATLGPFRISFARINEYFAVPFRSGVT